MKRWKRLGFAAVAAGALSVALSTWSAPVHYDEAASGDVDGRRFVFDVGTNTIKGRNRFVALYDAGVFLGFDIDTDSFGIDIGPSDVLVAARVEATFDDTTANTALLDMTWSLFDFGGNQSHTAYRLVDPAAASSAGGALWTLPLATGSFFLPVASGSYLVGAPSAAVWGGGRDFGDSYGGDVYYTLSFDVVRIAEPATLLVIGFALAGLVASRRRKG